VRTYLKKITKVKRAGGLKLWEKALSSNPSIARERERERRKSNPLINELL
jgi:hypothetical protein